MKTVEHVSLGRRVLVTNLVLVLGILVLGSASLWSLWGLRGRVLDVADEYDEVRLVERAMRHVAAAKACLMTAPVDAVVLTSELEGAVLKLDEFRSFQESERQGDEAHQDTETSLAGSLLREIRGTLDSLGLEWTSVMPDGVRGQLQNTLDRITLDLLELGAATDLAGARSSATTTASVAIGMIALLSGLLIVGAIVVSVKGYGRIMSPLRELQEGVRRIAAGRFQQRLQVEGDSEFIELADDFNRMATELDTLYRVMEEKVAQKSCELVRSERLASVGYLAAGVAHEINNPLSIMSGYAEMAKKWLDGMPDQERLADSRDALETIRAEAFRCKKITEQLLSLSRSGGDGKVPVAIGRIVSEVVRLASGPKGYRDRQIDLDCQVGDEVTVIGDEAELKQVLLNLIINSLRATEPDVGRVDIALVQRNGSVEVSVADNGCGIDAASLGNVFEPFWTSGRSDGTRGFGLGLSISHAIVEVHGGQLRAESKGVGLGSRFVMSLPLATAEDHHE